MRFPEFDELRKDAKGKYHIATDEFDETRAVGETNAQYKKRLEDIKWQKYDAKVAASKKKNEYTRDDYTAATNMIPKENDSVVAGTDKMTRAKNAITNGVSTAASIMSNQTLAPFTIGLNAAQSVANTYTSLANKEDIDLKTAIPQKISERLAKEDNVLSNEEAINKATEATKDFNEKRNELLDNYNSKARRDPNVARNTIDEYLSTYGGTKEDFYLDAQYRKTVTDKLAYDERANAVTEKINNGTAGDLVAENLKQGLKSYASSFSGLLEAVNKKAGGYQDKTMPINTYASGVREARINADIQEASKNKIQNAVGENEYAKGAAGMGYDLVSNMYTNGINRVVSKAISAASGSEAVGEAAGLSTFFGNAFTQALIDGQNKGLTENEQIALGTAQGIVEVGTEKIPFEIGQKYLFGEVGKKEFIKYFGREMRSEFWGEASASALDTMADIFVAKDKSDAIKMYNALIEDGESKEQAAFDVFISAATDAVYEGTIGFLSAAAGGGAYIVNSNIFSTAAGKALSNNSIALNELYENGFSDNESDYTSSGEYENAKRAKAEVLKALNDKAGHKKQTFKESRTLYKDVQNAIYDQAEARNNNRTKTTINNINDATTAEELAAVYEKSNKNEDIKKAYEVKKNALIANGISETEIDAAAKVYEKALNGELDKEQIESLPDTLKSDAMAATQNAINNQAANTSKSEVETVRVDNKYTKLTGNVIDKDGERYLELKGGELVKADSVEFNKNGELFMRGKLGFRKGALDVEDANLSSLMIKTMLSNSKVNSASILLALNTAYHLGETGVSYDSFKKGYSFYFDSLSEKTLKEAFNLGDKAETIDTKAEAKTSKKGDGTHTFLSQEAEEEYNTLSDLEKNVLDSFASALGITFNLTYDKNSNKRGAYDPSTGSINLNLKYSNKLFEVALHEGVGEFLQAHNKAGYDKISMSILNYYASTQANKLSDEINRYLKAYKLGGESQKTHRAAANELVNDALADIFSHEGALAEITRWIYENESQAKAKTFAKTLTDYLNAIREAIKSVVEMRKLDSRRLKMLDSEATKFAKEITTALDEAIKNRDAAVGNVSQENENRNSIVTLQDENGNNVEGVLLDTPLYTGKRSAKIAFYNFINSIAGMPFTVYGPNNEAYIIEIAKEKDRVKKDGANRDHVVLGKLQSAFNNRVKNKSILMADEVIAVSQEINRITEHTHQWMDENGWIFRDAYVKEVEGDTYKITLNIADGKERRILYDIKPIKNISRAKVPTVQMDEAGRNTDIENIISSKAENATTSSSTEITSDAQALDIARNSFAGIESETYDEALWQKAYNMEKDGIDETIIFETTGFFKGMDNEWKYEIPDNEAELFRNGNQNLLKQNKDYARYVELLDKILFTSNSIYTDEEYEELEKLEDEIPDEIARYNTDVGKISDFLKHDKLFAAYPELELINVAFVELPFDIRGQFNPSINTIFINKELKEHISSDHQIKSTFLHELQHAIQHIEGFSYGASSEFWAAYKDDKIKDDMNRLDVAKLSFEVRKDVARKNNTPLSTADFVSESMAKVNDENIDYDINDHFAEVNKWKHYSKIYAIENEISKLERHILRLTNTSPDFLYFDTAGEIEARDVQSRMYLTSEERKEKFPMIDAKNVVYSSGSPIQRRFSIDVGKDDLGNELTNEQKEYFKNTKIVNEKGELKVVYHGSPAQFNIFDPVSFGGKNGVQEGYGIYFSDNKEVANTYGNAIEAYLNITKPASTLVKTIRKNDLVKLIKATCIDEANKLKVDGGYSSLNDALRDTWISNYVDTYSSPIEMAYKEVAQSILDTNFNDMDIISEVMYGNAIRDYKKAYDFYDILTNTLGFDGFETEWPDRETGKISKIYLALNSNQVKRIDNLNPTNNPDIRLSIDTEGNELTKEQQKFFAESQARNEVGNLMVLYHETNSEFNTFDTTIKGKGYSDYMTPFGIFLKPNDKTILSGTKQMKLYANITNMLEVSDRMDLLAVLRKDNAIANAIDKLDTIDQRYKEKYDKADAEWTAAIMEGGRRPKASRSESENAVIDEKLSKVRAALDEWRNAYDNEASNIKAKVTDYIKSLGYDGIHLINDAGSFGRTVETYIAFNPNQVKSVNNTNPTESADIRLSIDTEGNELTEAQQEFFKDSKAVDEDGKLLVLYHGTLDGNFDIFNTSDNDMIFMSNSRMVASKYTNAEYSFNVKDRTTTEHTGMFKMYANLKNPLIVEASKKVSGKYNIDISYAANTEKYSVVLTNGNETINKVIYGDEKLKETFGSVANQIINHYNNISYNKGLYSTYKYSLKNKKVEFSESSTWDAIPYENGTTSTDMIAKKAKAEGYDGVIIKNVIDDLSFSKNGIAATDVIAFNSNAVKLVDNTNPTESADIRYSIDVARNSFKEFGEASRYQDQLKETKVITTLLGTMNEALTDVKLDLDQIQAIEDEIVDKYKVDVERGDLGYRIMYAFHYMNKNKLNVDYETMMDYLLNLGDEVIANSNMTDPHDVEVYNEMRNALSSYKFKLTESELKEIESAFGGKSEWKSVFRSLQKYGIKLDNKNGQTLDSMYSQVRDDVLKITGIALEEDLVAEDQILAIINLMENDIAPKPYLWEGATDLDKSLTVVTDIIAAYYDLAAKQLEADIVNKTDKGKEAVAKAVKRRTAELKNQVERYKKAQTDAFYAKVKEINTKLQAQNEVVKQQNERIKEYSKALEKEKTVKEKVYILDQKQIERTARARASEKIESYKTTQERAAKIDNIKKTGARLIKWLDNPTDKQHIPGFMQKPLAEFLAAIDFLPKNAKADAKNTLTWQQRMQSLRELLVKIDASERNGENNVESYFAQGIVAKDLIAMMDDFLGTESFDEYTQSYIVTKRTARKVSELSLDELTTLNNIMSALSTSINYMNKTYANAQFASTSELAIKAGDEMRELKKRKYGSEPTNVLFNFLEVEQLEPVTYFESFGSAATSIFDELKGGFINRTKRIKETAKYMTEAKKELDITDNESKKWEKETITFNLNEGTIVLSIPQIMTLYELTKRKQALPHIAIGGIKASDIEYKVNVKGKIEKTVVSHQVRPVHVTGAELSKIISSLSDKQVALADKMQQYMTTECSKWGNNVTEKMYGYSKFLEDDYFPIRTDSATRATNTSSDMNVSYYTIKNQGFTKALTPSANNSVVLDNVFDVFTNHVVGMANYESYVMPIADAMRWYNYNETYLESNEEGLVRRDTNNIKNLIDDVAGIEGQKYFEQFIKDINGDTAGRGDTIELTSKLMGNFKAAAVMANVRVIVQQPTAIVRAMERIEGKYLLKAQLSIPQIKAYASKAQENSMLAYWKAQGYYETLIGQSLKAIITGESTLRDTINDIAGKPAGLADDLTWGMMYKAAELKVEDTTELKKGSKEFDEKVVEVFEDVINHTQVVDTIFNKSQYMRNQGAEHKMTSAFMAEPTKTYNMLYRAYFDLKQDKSKENIKKAGRIAYIFLLEQAVNAAVTAVIDALRDDDKEKMDIAAWYEHFIDNFKGDINVLGIIPLCKEVVSALEGYDPTNYQVQPIYTAINTITELNKVIHGESKKTPYGIMAAVADGISQLFGIPVASALREVKTIYNNVNDFWGGKDWVKTQTKATAIEKKSYTKPIDEAIREADTAKIKEAMTDYYNYKLEGYLESKDETEAKKAAKEAAGQYITQTYKQELIDTYNSDINAANELKRSLLDAYVAIGYDRAEKNKVINKWIK